MFEGAKALQFYSQPMENVYIETVVVYTVWLAAAIYLRGRVRRVAAAVFLVLSVALIVFYTIIGRSPSGECFVSLVPFSTFELAKAEPEFYRSMYMNIILFMPFGLSLPFVLPEKLKFKVLITAAAGMLLSIAVELIQFRFSFGNCETDDVLMNTLGAFTGATSLWLQRLISGKIEKIGRSK